MRRELGDRLDRSDLVVRVHHRHDARLGRHDLAQGVGRQHARGAGRQHRRAPSAALERLHRVQNGLVLDAGGDEMPASGRLERVSRAAQARGCRPRCRRS